MKPLLLAGLCLLFLIGGYAIAAIGGVSPSPSMIAEKSPERLAAEAALTNTPILATIESINVTRVVENYNVEQEHWSLGVTFTVHYVQGRQYLILEDQYANIDDGLTRQAFREELERMANDLINEQDDFIVVESSSHDFMASFDY